MPVGFADWEMLILVNFDLKGQNLMGPVVILRYLFFHFLRFFWKTLKMTLKICSVYLVFSKIQNLTKIKFLKNF